MLVALVGSPNSGKTTLFNALTGARQKTGNYAGVTVEKKEGHLQLLDNQSQLSDHTLLDLPGAYSLDAKTPDEAITAEIVLGTRSDTQKPDLMIAVADTTNLERNLYLVLQLKDLGRPMLLALTMSDLAKRDGVKIDIEALAKQLEIPIVLVSAFTSEGLHALRRKAAELLADASTAPVNIVDKLSTSNELIIKRYSTIESVIRTCVTKIPTRSESFTKKLDRLLLHRIAGPVIMVLAFALMFQLVFTVAKVPMDWINNGIALTQSTLQSTLPDGALKSVLIDGALAGVGAVLVFLPQIVLLFACILFLEDSGYMARAAFILDRLMGKVGLHGRAFIPLMSSFACAVPGIMATRSIESRRDRIITIMISPLMTCSARLPVYTLLIATFFPDRRVFGIFTVQGLTMAGFYFFGVFAAVFVALVLKKTILKGKPSPFVLELPTYKMPSFRNLGLNLIDRARIFLRRAGTVILLLSILLWALASYPKVETPAEFASNEKAVAAYQIEHSIIGRAGRAFEPLIRPLGFDWKIGIGLLSSFAAREVVLSALGTVYAIGYDKDDTSALSEKLRHDAKFTIATALSMLVFYALACQCISTIAITRRETNSWRWPIFMFSYMTGLAYIASFFVYRLANLIFV